MGYQGWFGCPGDDGVNTGWQHWFFPGEASAGRFSVDALPAVEGLPRDRLCPTGLRHVDGTPILLYSAQDPVIVAIHFRWMADHGIDGAALQRFVTQTQGAERLRRSDRLLANERAAAAAAGRAIYICYDVSGLSAADAVAALRQDWRHLVRDLHVTDDPAYLRVGGKPVLEIWGYGFTDRAGKPDEVAALLQSLKAGGDLAPGAYLIGGVPTHWRTADRDSKGGKAWAQAYRLYDAISPWTPGRFTDDAGADNWVETVAKPDLAETRRLGILYMPVVFPGMSAANLHVGRGLVHEPGAVSNRTPRRCGAFFRRQVRDLVAAGAKTAYVAMFDEVDEGTALMPIEDGPGRQPQGARMVARDQEGCALPGDWYLRLAGEAATALRTGNMPPEPAPGP